MAQDARKVIERLRRARQIERGILRVASYNIHGCVGTDYRYDVERIAQVIRELGCDTIGLQEVDGRPSLLADSMQLEFLAKATGMTPVMGSMPFDDTRPFGNALLTLREVQTVRQYDLTFAGCERRSALDVRLKTIDGTVRVMVTHLGLRASERRFQVKKILTVLRAIPSNEPVVVLGDINEWLPLGRPLRWMHRRLGRSPGKRSFPVWAPVLALDRVWTRAPARLLELEAYRSPRARVASDHFPVRATVAANACPRPARVS